MTYQIVCMLPTALCQTGGIFQAWLRCTICSKTAKPGSNKYSKRSKRWTGRILLYRIFHHDPKSVVTTARSKGDQPHYAQRKYVRLSRADVTTIATFVTRRSSDGARCVYRAEDPNQSHTSCLSRLVFQGLIGRP